MNAKELSKLGRVEFTDLQAETLVKAAKRSAQHIGCPVAQWSELKRRITSVEKAANRILRQTNDDTPEADFLTHILRADAMEVINGLPGRMADAKARVEQETTPGRDNNEPLQNFVSYARSIWRDAGGTGIGGYKSDHHTSNIAGPLIDLIEKLLTDAGCEKMPSRSNVLRILKTLPEIDAQISYSGIHAPRG